MTGYVGWNSTTLEKLFGGFGTLDRPMNFMGAVSTSNPDPEVSLEVPHTTPDELYAPQTLRGITEGKSVNRRDGENWMPLFYSVDGLLSDPSVCLVAF